MLKFLVQKKMYQKKPPKTPILGLFGPCLTSSLCSTFRHGHQIWQDSCLCCCAPVWKGFPKKFFLRYPKMAMTEKKLYLLYCKPKNWPSFTKNVPEINHTFQWSRNKNPHELSLPYYYAKKAKFPIKIEKPEFLKKTIPVSCFLDYFVIGFGNKNSRNRRTW